MIGSLLRLMDCRPFKGKLRGPEDILAIDVATMLRVETLEGRLLATWTSIPHEVGAMSLRDKGFNLAKARYAKAKAMGLITGSADYVFVWPQGGGWIELKPKGGSLSQAQKDFREWAATAGSHYAVCRSVDEVRDKLFEWGALRPARDRG